MNRFPFPLAIVLFVCSLGVGAKGMQVNLRQNTVRLMPCQVLELTFQHEGRYASPAWDVTVRVLFTSPTGNKFSVGGFFYGSSQPQKPILGQPDTRGRILATWPCVPADLWKARFAPNEIGDWRFDYLFRNDRGESTQGNGQFKVVPGRLHQKGFVRINPDNRFRFVFDDGSPYWPIGFQDGVGDGNNNGSVMDVQAVEGPFRLDSQGTRPKTPPGALFARGPSMGPINGDVKFGRASRAGFNLWRFSPHNNSMNVFYQAGGKSPGLDEVNWKEAQMVDEMLLMTRKYGFHNFYGIFGFTPAGNDLADDPLVMAKVKRIIQYSVDRWGAYVDFWELFNEQKAPPAWYAVTVPYVKSIDPYHPPVTTSWEHPELEGIEINAPHWYGNEPELNSDQATAGRAQRDKKFKKPVVYGEQGNALSDRKLMGADGWGGVWDPGSARRMRVRSWTSLFNEVTLIFWETSYAKDGHYMNLWIGPEERQYIHALQDFTSKLEAGVNMVKIPLQGPQAGQVRAYGLRSANGVAVYLHHSHCGICQKDAQAGLKIQHQWNHDRGDVNDLRVMIDVPKAAKGYWYNPVDAGILGSFAVPVGVAAVSVPAFKVDLALLVTDQGPPDSDHDGIPNDIDDDNDNDGVPNMRDAFPLEREEWADVDGDRIGDNMDADIDGDGVADDLNKNGIPDNAETDWDGDGYPNANAVPWDAFPRDPKEWKDTDGDGIGDNADTDKDGDGYSDEEERKAGTDPLDPLSFPDESVPPRKPAGKK